MQVIGSQKRPQNTSKGSTGRSSLLSLFSLLLSQLASYRGWTSQEEDVLWPVLAGEESLLSLDGTVSSKTVPLTLVNKHSADGGE